MFDTNCGSIASTTEEREDEHEDLDDVNVEHQSGDDVLVHAIDLHYHLGVVNDVDGGQDDNEYV